MSVVEKVSAILEGFNRRDVDHLTPQQRKKLAWVLRSVADLADPPASPHQQSGILAQLEKERAP
jgi:hypothetical protein